MNADIYAAFEHAMRGKNEQVVLLPHPIVPFLAQNFNNHAALLAKVSLTENQVIPDGKGFSVATERSGLDQYVRFVSTDPGISLLFLKLVDYLLDRTANAHDLSEASQLLVVAVGEFRRFTQRRPGRLGEDAIRGLVAELKLLLHLHGGHSDRTWELFHAWGGPFGSLHDFEFSNGMAIEVKSSHRPATEVRVSSPEQTWPVPDRLELLVLPLERVAAGAPAEIQFPQLVRAVGSLASVHGGDVAELWESALEALGLDLDDEYYDQWRFAHGDWLRYTVNESFPNIRESEIPVGIVKIGYSLRLDSLSLFAKSFADLEVFS